MRDKIILGLSGVSLFGILAMLNYTSPMKAGVLGVLVFFTMIFMLFFGIMVGLIKVFQKILSDKRSVGGRTADNKVYMYAVVAAFGPIMLLMVQAFAVVNIFTIMLVMLFVFLGCFLVHKRA